MKILIPSLLAAGALVSNGATIASYSAGVSPTSGTTGAANPTSQGWTETIGITNNFVHGADSDIGGWRITDGSATTNSVAFYSQAISAENVLLMTTDGWSVTWTAAVNADAINSAGGGSDGYYAGDNSARQFNNGILLELVGGPRFQLLFRTNASGDVFINDGTSDYSITTNYLSQELGTGAPLANYVTYTLTYNGGIGTLTDSFGGNRTVAQLGGSAASDRIVWGAHSSGTQGSSTWNSVLLVPEPSAALLGGLGVLALLRRRRD